MKRHCGYEGAGAGFAPGALYAEIHLYCMQHPARLWLPRHRWLLALAE